MPVELLLQLLAWAASVSLVVVLPWAVVRLVVGVHEARQSKLGADREPADVQTQHDEKRDPALSHDPDGVGDSIDAVSTPRTRGEDASGADR